MTKPSRETQIAVLDKIREIVMARPEQFDMSKWHGEIPHLRLTNENNVFYKPHLERRKIFAEHGSCGTSHCIAGWVEVLIAAMPEMKLEQYVDWTHQPSTTAMIASQILPDFESVFYRTNAQGYFWLENRVYASREIVNFNHEEVWISPEGAFCLGSRFGALCFFGHSITGHRNPTQSEINRGYGAIHYKDFPAMQWAKPDGTPKKWIVCESDGLRYYR